MIDTLLENLLKDLKNTKVPKFIYNDFEKFDKKSMFFIQAHIGMIMKFF